MPCLCMHTFLVCVCVCLYSCLYCLCAKDMCTTPTRAIMLSTYAHCCTPRKRVSITVQLIHRLRTDRMCCVELDIAPTLVQAHRHKLRELLRCFLLTCASGRGVAECFPSRYVHVQYDVITSATGASLMCVL